MPLELHGPQLHQPAPTEITLQQLFPGVGAARRGPQVLPDAAGTRCVVPSRSSRPPVCSPGDQPRVPPPAVPGGPGLARWPGALRGALVAGEARGSLPPRCARRRAALVATYPAPGAREAGAARRGGAPRGGQKVGGRSWRATCPGSGGRSASSPGAPPAPGQPRGGRAIRARRGGLRVTQAAPPAA